MGKSYYMYIASNKANTVLYVGVTNDLVRRMFEHNNKFVSGFTAKYHVHNLVYFEMFASILDAITREKQFKGGSRKKKLALIEKFNPTFEDLYERIL